MFRTLRTFALGGVAALLLAAVPAAARAQTLTLAGNESPTTGFGKGGTATYGQTFTAPIGTTGLQSFSFWLSNDATLNAVNAGSLMFRGYLMQWDAANSLVIGPLLYTSTFRTGPTSLSQRYDFATPGVALNAGVQYVAFLSASGLFGSIAPAEALAVMETTQAGTYTGGSFVFADNGNTFGDLATVPWFAGGREYQSHFSATFTSPASTVVPEPSSLVLLASGLAVMVSAGFKRRRR